MMMRLTFSYLIRTKFIKEFFGSVLTLPGNCAYKVCRTNDTNVNDIFMFSCFNKLGDTKYKSISLWYKKQMSRDLFLVE